jgi:hypothetical protein
LPLPPPPGRNRSETAGSKTFFALFLALSLLSDTKIVLFEQSIARSMKNDKRKRRKVHLKGEGDTREQGGGEEKTPG